MTSHQVLSEPVLHVDVAFRIDLPGVELGRLSNNSASSRSQVNIANPSSLSALSTKYFRPSTRRMWRSYGDWLLQARIRLIATTWGSS